MSQEPMRSADTLADEVVVRCIEAGFSCPNGNHMWRSEIKDAIESERSESDALREEIENWKKWNIVEIASRNPQILEYCAHWEGRAIKAEARIKTLEKDSQRLDWLDHNASFVADEKFCIGPYKVGELRKMADDGIEQSKHKKTTLQENLGQG